MSLCCVNLENGLLDYVSNCHITAFNSKVKYSFPGETGLCHFSVNLENGLLDYVSNCHVAEFNSKVKYSFPGEIGLCHFAVLI